MGKLAIWSGRPVRLEGKTIGYVSTKADDAEGTFSVYRVTEDGGMERFGCARSQRKGSAMVREDHEKRRVSPP